MGLRNRLQRRGPLSAGVFEHEGYSRKLPTYPEKAKDAHTEGRVEIQVLVTKTVK